MNSQQISNITIPTKRERLEFRITKKQKILFKQAAKIQGRSLSDFLASSAEKAAQDIIKENLVIQLSVEDSLTFANAILNPPKLSNNLKTAFISYKKAVSSK